MIPASSFPSVGGQGRHLVVMFTLRTSEPGPQGVRSLGHSWVLRTCVCPLLAHSSCRAKSTSLSPWSGSRISVHLDGGVIPAEGVRMEVGKQGNGEGSFPYETQS